MWMSLAPRLTASVRSPLISFTTGASSTFAAPLSSSSSATTSSERPLSSYRDEFPALQRSTYMVSHSLGAIMALGLMLLAILILWLFAAYFVYAVTLGPEPPESVTSFVRDVLTTPAGWTMAGVGVGVGFLFALLVLTISVVSNPGPMAMWGLIIAASLAVGVIPLLFGLAIVLPVLGHATWHLYRKVLPR